jgi:hypothetical protein
LRLASVSEMKNAMAQSEIESFILKFKPLLNSGKNANLNLGSEGGKTFITLTVEVEPRGNS